MKTTLTIMFIAIMGTAGLVANKAYVTDKIDVNEQQLYACAWYPLCTLPDIYSPVTIKDSKDKAKDTSNDKLKLA
ncbi:hypothetical protein [Rheinheimera sp. EpRS3]|uniref:hypothetical protein n=1 Tax=Rheinheimera sp. EpRS3 TaxID=1712383 RepID=UPI00074A93A1|nr:hypothetical protein [Rheinheimera sp. EpRS3]KUM53093.1 hypothetical protein AR688_03970 [Rheinheimera sp. EpRS3]